MRMNNVQNLLITFIHITLWMNVTLWLRDLASRPHYFESLLIPETIYILKSTEISGKLPKEPFDAQNQMFTNHLKQTSVVLREGLMLFIQFF